MSDPPTPAAIAAASALTDVLVTADDLVDNCWWVRATLEVPGRGPFAARWPWATKADAQLFADDQPIVQAAARQALSDYLTRESER